MKTKHYSKLQKHLLGIILDILGFITENIDCQETVYYCELISYFQEDFKVEGNGRDFLFENSRETLEALEEIHFQLGNLEFLSGSHLDVDEIADMVNQCLAEMLYYELVRDFEEEYGVNIWDGWFRDDITTFMAFKNHLKAIYRSI